MPSIAAATYADHQARVKYPLDLISLQLGWCDQIYWFASDEENVKVFNAEREKVDKSIYDKIKIVNLNHKITSPDHISIAQNKSVEWLKSNCSTDFIAFQQADLIVTPYGAGIMQEWMQNPDAEAKAFAAMQSKLYFELMDNPFGIVIMRKTYRYKAIPGWIIQHNETDVQVSSVGTLRKEKDPWKHDSLISNHRLMMDLGYLDTAAYYRKLVNHANIWPDRDWKEQFRKAYDRNIEEGIELSLRRIMSHEERFGNEALVKYDGQYKWLIDLAGLREDFQRVRKVADKIGIK